MFDTRIVHEKYMMFEVDSVEMSGESRQSDSFAWHGIAMRVFIVASIEYSIDPRKLTTFVRQAGWLTDC